MNAQRSRGPPSPQGARGSPSRPSVTAARASAAATQQRRRRAAPPGPGPGPGGHGAPPHPPGPVLQLRSARRLLVTAPEPRTAFFPSAPVASPAQRPLSGGRRLKELVPAFASRVSVKRVAFGTGERHRPAPHRRGPARQARAAAASLRPAPGVRDGEGRAGRVISP